MKIILLETKCRHCRAKLTEYEAREKDGLCMECYKDEYPAPASSKKKIV